jgi:hypothetical protein
MSGNGGGPGGWSCGVSGADDVEDMTNSGIGVTALQPARQRARRKNRVKPLLSALNAATFRGKPETSPRQFVLASTPGGNFFLNIFSAAFWIFSAFFLGSSETVAVAIPRHTSFFVFALKMSTTIVPLT